MSDVTQDSESNQQSLDEAILSDENAPIDEVRAALKREQKRRRDAQSGVNEAERLRREVAFLRAGVDDSPLGQLFTKGYDGELDPEAIRAAWTEIAPAPAAAPPSTPEVPGAANAADTDVGKLTEEQLEQLRRSRQGLQSESAPPGQEPATPLGQAIMDAAYEKQGGVRARPPQGMNDASLNAGFSELFRRANEGDPSAVFKRTDEPWDVATDRWRETKS